MPKLEIVTIIIIALNAIITYKGLEDFSFFERYKFNIGRIKQGEQLRLFSSGFLHVNLQHFIFNMFTLVFFANVVIYNLGIITFLIIYCVSLISGSLLSLVFHKNEYHYSAVGASGAVTGILYAAILISPEMRLGLLFIPIPIPGYIFGVGYLLYSIYGMKKQIGNIGHDAHFGGAIGGYLATLLLAPSLLTSSFTMVVILAIPIILLFVLKRLGKI